MRLIAKSLQPSLYFILRATLAWGVWGLALSPASAQQASLSMPFGVIPSGQDRIRSADGVECQTHVGPRNRWMDMGVYSMGTQTNNLPSTPNSSQAIGVYARITINLDPVAPQLDCSRLYQLEIDRLRREVEDQQMDSIVTVQPR